MAHDIKIEEWKTQAGYTAALIERSYVSIDGSITRLYGYVEIPKGHVWYKRHTITLNKEEQNEVKQIISCSGDIIPRKTKGWWLGFEVSDDTSQNPIKSCEDFAKILKTRSFNHKLKHGLFIGGAAIIVLLAVYFFIISLLLIGTS